MCCKAGFSRVLNSIHETLFKRIFLFEINYLRHSIFIGTLQLENPHLPTQMLVFQISSAEIVQSKHQMKVF